MTNYTLYIRIKVSNWIVYSLIHFYQTNGLLNVPYDWCRLLLISVVTNCLIIFCKRAQLSHYIHPPFRTVNLDRSLKLKKVQFALSPRYNILPICLQIQPFPIKNVWGKSCRPTTTCNADYIWSKNNTLIKVSKNSFGTHFKSSFPSLV